MTQREAPATRGFQDSAPATQKTKTDVGLNNDFRKQKYRFEKLPGFAAEAAAMAQALKKHRPAWQLEQKLRTAADEEGLQTIQRPRLLYLITHGFFLPDLVLPKDDPLKRGLAIVGLDQGKPFAPLPSFGKDPRLRSGLALAGANRWPERIAKGHSDGLLTALEASNLDLRGTELVVLSACETGVGQVQIGEGVLGLRRAFQGAGARTVLASLWKVPDRETEKLMSRFFELWLTSTEQSGAWTKADALRQSQLELMASLRKEPDEVRRRAPPLFWAGFICHGQP